MNKLTFQKILLISIVSVFITINSTSQTIPDSTIKRAIRIASEHLAYSVQLNADSTKFPSYASDGIHWSYSKSSGWTSGFYPGCLWLAYELTADRKFYDWALRWTLPLEREKNNPGTHDLGFMINCSFGKALKHVPELDRLRFEEILRTAAKTLGSRYSEKTGFLRCYWDVKPYKADSTLYPVVIDIMMNLELMFWAAEHGGDKQLKVYATNHAKNSYRDFVREDGGTYHVVRYNKHTGEVINKGQLQGQREKSTWTRGHAWFIYGMTSAYRYTHDKELLKYACSLADYFLLRLSKDNVSIWDFDADSANAHIKDASATAIVTSALFELSSQVKNKKLKKKYYTKAVEMLSALCAEPYLAVHENTPAILLHSTQYLTQPGNPNTDKPAIFADYYFLESIQRYLLARNTDLRVVK